LLEVALAMAVMAICALGLMSTQLAIARHAQSAAARERAAFAADALAEASAWSSAAAIDAWKTRVAAIVPEGAAAITSAGADTSIATVTWALSRPPSSRDTAGASGCQGVTTSPERDCVALAFAR
jgi:Tfp pilus assembly protein PilV